MIPNKQTKPAPRVSQRPFPWRCHECGKKEVQPIRIQYDATLRHDGRLHSFTIPEIDIPVCGACGAKIITEDVDHQISIAFRNHVQLLLPEQITHAIQRIGLPQREIAKHLGIAEETLSRWINESQIQSRSMDTLLRLYFAFPEIREVLSGDTNRPELGLVDRTHRLCKPA